MLFIFRFQFQFGFTLVYDCGVTRVNLYPQPDPHTECKSNDITGALLRSNDVMDINSS